MKNSINSLVPNEDARLALLLELHKCGGEGDTGYIVDHAMAHFSALQKPSELNRETPSGRPWWPGRFRFDLSSLGKADEARNFHRGSWRITPKGITRLKKAGYRVGKELATQNIQEEGRVMSERTVTEKLMDLWMENSEGTKAQKCQQICERILGLLSLGVLEETQEIFKQLREILDFNELYQLSGRLGVSGVWDAFNEDELFPKSGVTNLTPDEAAMELFYAWSRHSEESKAQNCQQVSERIFGLLSLMAVKETEDIFHQLWKSVSFDELYRLSGKLGATGIWGVMDEGDVF